MTNLQIFLIVTVSFWTGYGMNELLRRINKALTEAKWQCPHCSIKITTNQKEFLIQYKTDHLAQHILK